MGMFSKEQMNHALLGMYVGTRGPKTLRKCIIDKLFIYRMYRNEETIRKHLDADMVLLTFPGGQPVPSLDDLDDLVVRDIGRLAFSVSKNDHDISKLRISIQKTLEGPVFQEYLQSRKHLFFKKNRKKRLLSKTQFAKLYPETGDSCIFDLDVSVLAYILFEGMNFTPLTDFDKLPPDSAIDEADDMLRIKICRNILVHQPVAEISDEHFETYWECLTGAFERLLKSACVRRESERLKSLRLSDEKIDQFKAMIQEWRMDEQDIRTEQLEQIKDIVTQSGSETERVIRATETKIVENQNEKHEQLVSLLRKNGSKRRKVQKELKKSFPLRINGYDKFKQVCHFMENRGIKYSIPTASSSDSSPTDGSPRNSQDMIPMFPPLDKDMEDEIYQMPINDRPYTSSPLHYIANECRSSDFDSSTDSSKHTSRIFGVRQNSQWKRTTRAKNMSTQRKRSPRRENGKHVSYDVELSMTPSKNGLYSEDSPGYNSDLISFSSSMDGNMSDSLFRPQRQHVPRKSRNFLLRNSEMTSEEDENSSDNWNPFQLSIFDDGYISYPNASSLERSHSHTRYRYDSPTHLVPDSKAGFVANRKNQDCSSKEMADIGEIGTDSLLPKFESLLMSDSEKEKEKKPDVNQEIPNRVVKMLTHPLKSASSTDISGPLVFVPVPITQLLQKSSQNNNTSNDGGEELQEIFV